MNDMNTKLLMLVAFALMSCSCVGQASDSDELISVKKANNVREIADLVLKVRVNLEDLKNDQIEDSEVRSQRIDWCVHCVEHMMNHSNSEICYTGNSLAREMLVFGLLPMNLMANTIGAGEEIESCVKESVASEAYSAIAFKALVEKFLFYQECVSYSLLASAAKRNEDLNRFRPNDDHLEQISLSVLSYYIKNSLFLQGGEFSWQMNNVILSIEYSDKVIEKCLFLITNTEFQSNLNEPTILYIRRVCGQLGPLAQEALLGRVSKFRDIQDVICQQEIELLKEELKNEIEGN